MSHTDSVQFSDWVAQKPATCLGLVRLIFHSTNGLFTIKSGSATSCRSICICTYEYPIAIYMDGPLAPVLQYPIKPILNYIRQDGVLTGIRYHLSYSSSTSEIFRCARNIPERLYPGKTVPGGLIHHSSIQTQPRGRHPIYSHRKQAIRTQNSSLGSGKCTTCKFGRTYGTQFKVAAKMGFERRIKHMMLEFAIRRISSCIV
jgi:hypothetical protein